MDKISDIKAKYKEIINRDIMAYDSIKQALYGFIDEYNSDERTGVISQVEAAKKKIERLEESMRLVEVRWQDL